MHSPISGGTEAVGAAVGGLGVAGLTRLADGGGVHWDLKGGLLLVDDGGAGGMAGLSAGGAGGGTDGLNWGGVKEGGKVLKLCVLIFTLRHLLNPPPPPASYSLSG
mmetsp:Transcript_3069/g.6907  ORF Transcript_3069/g.6907 Transcript_3069/m.6907 type:complete len:106 (-) Transcript_3069:4377-4694(-)